MYQGGVIHLPGGGAYLLKIDTDPGFIEFTVRNRLISKPILVTSVKDMGERVSAFGLSLYGTDDYGPHLNGIAMPSGESFNEIDRKSELKRYVPPEFSPVEIIVDLTKGLPKYKDILALSQMGRLPIYLKIDNGEHGNTVVFCVDLGPVEAMSKGIAGILAKYTETYKHINAEVDAAEIAVGSRSSSRTATVWQCLGGDNTDAS
jgi:hypothetical protein